MATFFRDSAFKHGFGEDDYHEVCRNRNVRVRSRRGHPGVYEVFGRNDVGEYVHIVTRRYVYQGERVVMVFHMASMGERDRRWFRRMTQP